MVGDAGQSVGELAWRKPLVRGLRALARGDSSAALALFRTAHELGPEIPEVCLAYGRELARRGNDDGLALMRKAHRAEPPLMSATCELARALQQRGLVVEARAVLDEGRQRSPQDDLLWVTVAELELDDGNEELARQAAETALAHSQSEAGQRAANAILARCHNSDGLALAASGRFDESLFAFKRARDRDPGWAAPLVNMGAAMAKLGQPARALGLYEQALAIEADDPVTLFDVGALHLRVEQWGAARLALERSVQLQLSSESRSAAFLAHTQRLLARCYRELGADTRAVRALEHASHLLGAGAEVWAELARAHVTSGDLSKARRAARIALELAPDHPQVRTAWTELARARARQRQPKRPSE